MTAPRIRPAGLAQADILAALHATAFESSWAALAIAELLATPGTFALLAADGAAAETAPAAPLGFVLCRLAGGECEVLTLAVRPDARRRGVAAALLTKAVDHADRSGAKTTVLEVAENNVAARRLYARLGFREVGRRLAYYRSTSGASKNALILRRGGAD